MDKIVEETAYIMNELNMLSTGGQKSFNAKAVIEFAQDIAARAKKKRSSYPKEDIDLLIMGADGLKNNTNDFIKQAKRNKREPEFWSQEYKRLAYSSLKMISDPVERMFRVKFGYNPFFKRFEVKNFG